MAKRKVIVVGSLPQEIAQFVVPRLDAGRILFDRHGAEIASFNLDRFGVPDVSKRLCAADARQKLDALYRQCNDNLAGADKNELEAWLLAIGLLLAHLHGINRASGLQELLLLHEFAGECSHVVRFLRTGMALTNSAISAIDWFADLVPTIPPGEGGQGFLGPAVGSRGEGISVSFRAVQPDGGSTPINQSS